MSIELIVTIALPVAGGMFWLVINRPKQVGIIASISSALLISIWTLKMYVELKENNAYYFVNSAISSEHQWVDSLTGIGDVFKEKREFNKADSVYTEARRLLQYKMYLSNIAERAQVSESKSSHEGDAYFLYFAIGILAFIPINLLFTYSHQNNGQSNQNV